jgi:predicted AlkP superfamily phosphohydrolase/phosphomutase
MKIERKKRPTRFECELYTKEYYEICVEMNDKYKRCLEDYPSLDDNSVSLIKEIIGLNESAIEKCEKIFKSSHRTRRPECKIRRLRKH